jgi:PAS domain S-box-containing protein
LDYYEDCVREKKLYDKVHRVVLPNGKIKVIHRKGEFILNEQGEVIKMVGTTQDVTKEYKVQQELKENQTFIRKITDATPSIIASYNINTGKYVFISEGLEKLLGYSTGEVMERGLEFFINVVHPDDALLVLQKNAKALEEANADPSKSDIVIEFTYRMKHRNGEYRWFHTYGTIFDRNNAGKVEHVLNITLDVTEQVNATEKIKEQEHFIQQIADASPTILYLFDVDSQGMVYINREIFFVLGYSPDEILQYKNSVTKELYHPEDIQLLPSRTESQKTFQQVGSMIQYECRIRNKEGEWKWFLVREIVFKTNDKGNITQILGAALDITRRKEMEKTILQNSMLLEQSNASLEEFAYVASHDLKEPLRKISTFGDRLIATQGENMSPDGKIYLNKIIDASQRMQTMITDLLSVSMITGNTAFESYSLQKILDETLQTLEFKLEQLNASLQLDPLPEAYIIPSQFRQLFQNLLSNSLKFVKPGVQPVISISYSLVPSEKIIHYQLARVDYYHQLRFADNGIGFDNEYAGKIFAIFQRLHGRSEYEGSGIGLAICKKIVEHHGGIIYAQGKEGEGATFTIILPA